MNQRNQPSRRSPRKLALSRRALLAGLGGTVMMDGFFEAAAEPAKPAEPKKEKTGTGSSPG